jgi:hypothetical protein
MAHSDGYQAQRLRKISDDNKIRKISRLETEIGSRDKSLAARRSRNGFAESW